jgi:hypothetical protein
MGGMVPVVVDSLHIVSKEVTEIISERAARMIHLKLSVWFIVVLHLHHYQNRDECQLVQQSDRILTMTTTVVKFQ